jgi:hypothetical protein
MSDSAGAGSIARTPEPPYYAVVFTSLRSAGDPEGYAQAAAEMTASPRSNRATGIERPGRRWCGDHGVMLGKSWRSAIGSRWPSTAPCSGRAADVVPALPGPRSRVERDYGWRAWRPPPASAANP